MSVATDLEDQTGGPALDAGPRLRRTLFALDLDPSQKFGSLEEQVFLLADAFGRRGSLLLPLYVAMPGPRGLAPYRAAGLPVAALDLRRFRPGALARLLRLVLAHRIEVVHWNFYPPLTNGYVWALTLLAPWVHHYFTDHNSRLAPPARGRALPQLAKRLLATRFARVVGVSRFVVEYLRRQDVWPNLCCRLHFINTERFRPDEATRAAVRRQLGAEDRFVLVTVANLIRPKGVDVLLRALAGLPERVVLWVVGDGEEATALRRLGDELGVAGRVSFLGLRCEVEPYLRAADCFVCPSVWAEAAGLVVIEAQACGLPIVASDVGGIPEYVADGETGLLSPAGDAGRLAACLRRLFDDPAGRGRMGARARRRAVEWFSPAARLGDFLDLYRRPS